MALKLCICHHSGLGSSTVVDQPQWGENLRALSLIAISVMVASLSGCGSAGVRCDGGDVKELIFDIARKQNGRSFHFWKAGYHVPEGMTLSQLAESGSEEAKRHAKESLEEVAMLALDVVGIRTLQIDEDTGRYRCAATLTIGSPSAFFEQRVGGRESRRDIIYTAQYTHDGMVHVELGRP